MYEFAPEMDPVYVAEDGESLTIETIDSLNGAIQTDEDRLTAISERGQRGDRADRSRRSESR